jgi:hypothetical protein
MKQRKLFLYLAFLALLIAIVAEVMMWLTAMLDGKYTLTESSYTSHINSFAIALIISDLVILCLLIWIVLLLNKKE